MAEHGTMAELDVALVLTSEADPERAEALAQTLLEQRPGACGRLPPCRLLQQYGELRWQGSIEKASEVLLLLKTRPDRLEELYSRVKELHSYETPMWLHWRAGSSAAYGGWLAAALTGDAAALTGGEAALSPGGVPPAPAVMPGDGDRVG